MGWIPASVAVRISSGSKPFRTDENSDPLTRLYTFDQLIHTPDFIKALEPFEASVRQWDDPDLDQYIRSLLDSQKLREKIKAIKTE